MPWFDLQVNGYAGVDFNGDALDVEEVRQACRRLKREGVAGILATVITAAPEAMTARLQRIARMLEADPEIAETIDGIHIEGPFINPQTGFVGAHPPEAVVTADPALMDRLLEAADGHARLVTLAPEMDPDAALVQHLADRGITVAAGHSDATLDQLRRAIDAGLRMFTHLGNGCPNLLPRHDNIIQRVLSLSEQLAVSFIADGHHVPLFALANYLRRVPDENIVIVTDAIAAAGLGPGIYPLGGQEVYVDQQGAAWSADRTHFAGSAATMPEMHRLLADRIGATAAQLQAWMQDNPRRLVLRDG